MPTRARLRSARSRGIRTGAAVGIVVAVAIATGLAFTDRGTSTAAETPVTVYAAGDLGGSASEVAPVATLIKNDPATNRALLLGDICYPDGTPSCYPSVLDPTYGPIKSKVIAAPGNHDYHTTNGAGFFGYFPDTIPRAWDIGNGWVVITVNTEVTHSAGSPMETQVKSLLAANAGKHIIGITHHPRYTGGSSHGDDTAGDAIFADLDNAKADLYLTGHNHIYERFQPMGAGGQLRSEGLGVRPFTVGTGGNGLYSCTSHVGRQFCDDSHHGALRLKLFSDHYDWAFVTTSGQTLDAGSAPTRTGGVPPSTTTSTSSSTTSSSTSSTTSTVPSTTSSTTTTTTPQGCVNHASDLVLTPTTYLNLLYKGCWDGGVYWDTDDPAGHYGTAGGWEHFHHSGCFTLRGPATVKNTVCVNFGDGYRVENGNGFVFDHVMTHVGHDDCFENDANHSGWIASAYCSGFVTYSSQGGSRDGSGDTVNITDSWMQLFPIHNTYKGPDTPYNKYPADSTGGFFKTDSHSPGFVLNHNVFVAQVIPASYGTLGPPPVVRSCKNNIVIWFNKSVPFPVSAKSAWLAKCPDTTFVGA